MKVQIFAHRGSKGTHPENTMAAFIEAERAGADGIEFDVQLSADGEMVVIHDETLDRTTSMQGYVKDYTARELKEADAGIAFAKAFTGERIPLLREVFEWAASNQLLMNAELKNDKIPYPGLEEKVIEMVQSFGLEDRVILSSFNHSSIDRLKKLAPSLERALLFEELPGNILQVLAGKQEKGFHPKARTLNDELCRQARELGYKVRPWTANQEKEIRRLIDMEVHAIITDFPERAVKLTRP